MVTRYHFSIVHNEDYTFYEQVSIYSHAKYMISIHGAAMTNMLFMQEGSTIFELYKRWSSITDEHNFVFWYMADAMNYKYYQQSCESTVPEEHYFTANIIVDVAEFEKNLQLMLGDGALT